MVSWCHTKSHHLTRLPFVAKHKNKTRRIKRKPRYVLCFFCASMSYIFYCLYKYSTFGQKKIIDFTSKKAGRTSGNKHFIVPPCHRKFSEKNHPWQMVMFFCSLTFPIGFAKLLGLEFPRQCPSFKVEGMSLFFW